MTITGILKAAKHFVDRSDTKTPKRETSIATSTTMSQNSPSLDMFVAAIHEFREAVADPNYNTTTAREKLASTKGVIVDSQLVEKIRDLMGDIDKELYGSVYSVASGSTEHEQRLFLSQAKKIHMLQTMSYVEYKAFGKGERNESPPERKTLAFAILPDKESEMGVGGSSASQDKGQARTMGGPQGRNNKSALDEVSNGKSVGKEHDTFVEGATTDKGKQKQIESAANDVLNGKGTSNLHDTLHDMVVEGAATDKSKEEQSEPVVERPQKKKKKPNRKSKKNKMPIEDSMNDKGKGKENDDLGEASTFDKGKGKENELLVEGLATDKGKNKEIGLPPAESKVQGRESIGLFSPESYDLILEAKGVDLGPISDDEANRVSRMLAGLESSARNVHPQVLEAEKDAVMACRKMDRLMVEGIRPQTAAHWQLDLVCRFFEDPIIFELMSEDIEELRWKR